MAGAALAFGGAVLQVMLHNPGGRTRSTWRLSARLVLAFRLLTGLVVPHLLLFCGASDQRFLLPALALGGGALLLAANLVARSALNAGELPIGVITAPVGAPLFIYLLLRQDAYVAL